MHEISLCEGILDIITEKQQTDDFTRVTAIWLEIGRFSCIEKSALNFAFEAVMNNTPLQGAKMTILDLPGRALCYTCDQQVTLDDRFGKCPKCPGDSLMPIAGDEMRIKRIEVI